MELTLSQGFSLVNRQRSSLDPRNQEVFTVVREVERLRPDVFVMENVPGISIPLLDGRGGAVNFLEQILRRLVGDLG